MMKYHLLATIMTLAMSTSLAAAGGRDNTYLTSNAAADAVANASASSQSSSGAIAQGGNVVFNQPGHVRTSGTTTIRSAPQVVAPSMSSGHPCAYAPVSVGVSVVGFGGAFGGQRIDDACLLAQMQVRNAAISMIAARNPAACRALEVTGTIAPGYCGGSRRAVAVQQVVYRPNRPARQVVRTAPRRAVAASNGGCTWVQATASTKKCI